MDLNDHTLTGCIRNNGGKLTVRAGQGSISGSPYAIENLTGGTLTLESGTYSAVRSQGGAALTVSGNTAIGREDGPAVTIELGDATLQTKITISEDAQLTAPADFHLVEIHLLPEDAENGLYRDVIQQIPDIFLHRSVIDPGKDSTCTKSGFTEGIHCAVCDEILKPQVTIPAAGHVETPDEAVEPTCTESGLTAGAHCSVCDVVLSEQAVIPALGHSESEQAAVPPSCTDNGLTAGMFCSVCGEVLTAQMEIPALGHVEVVDAAVPASCTEDGLTAGIHCKVCHAILKAQTVMPALGHAVVIDEAAAPTCTEDGWTAGTHCAVCNAVLTARETVPAHGHDYRAGSVIVAADCGTEGRRFGPAPGMRPILRSGSFPLLSITHGIMGL